LFSLVTANLVVAWAFCLRADAITRCSGGRGTPAILYSGVVLDTILIFWFTCASDSNVARASLSALVIAPGMAFMGYLAIRSAGNENRFINGSFFVALSGIASLYVIRCIYWAFLPPESIFSADDFNSIFFVAIVAGEILGGVLFLMLNMVREQGEVAESEERYRILSENLPDFIVVHDGTSILYANPAAVRFTGISLEALAGQPITTFIAPESRAKSGQMIQTILATSAPAKPHEILIAGPDGRTYTCIVQSVPVRYGRGPAIMSVLTDITERKQIEEALRTVNRKLNLLSGITRHDIKNQLMALSAYLEISRTSLEDPVQCVRFIEKAMEVARTIENQISFTKDYEGLGVKAPVWQDVDALMKKILPRLPVRNIRIDCSNPGLEVFADPLLE
ncbi:PAS domain S-box protein, partial [Methanoregula sp.]|uniref:PAS domain S-box protein n=1 Tax=Methanoregula sp. TaxID=2052170 RepID=UPI000CA9F32F